MFRAAKALVSGMVLGICVAAAQTPPTDENEAQAATLQRAALYSDRSSAQFERLMTAIQFGTAADIDEKLIQYTRELSRFHVTVANLRIGKQELGFATRALNEVASQISRLEALPQNSQQGRTIALDEAVSHLRSAQWVIRQKLDSKSRSLFRVQGAGPSTPSMKPLWWEPRPGDYRRPEK